MTCCFTAESVIEEEVVVKMNDPKANIRFPSNFIKTSRYNALTFIPYNLFFQFRKVSNFYFLINMIFSFIPGVSSISPYTSALPLMFVIGVALLKDGYEEYLRHKADDRANGIIAHVMREVNGVYTFVDVQSKDVAVGDVMKIHSGEEIRADVIILSSSIVEGQAFIETANLDGETNLKIRRGVELTWALNTVEILKRTTLELHTTAPNPGLLSWNGNLFVNGAEQSVGLDQFLYRSSVLRNTEWVVGVVAYAGVDTKMFRNLDERAPKMSTLDEKLNKLIVLALLIQNTLLIILASLAVSWTNANKSHWYVRSYMDNQTGAVLWGYRYLTYFILLSYFIPISLFVTIELCKVAQAQFMAWDKEMHEWMNGKWHGCKPNTSNLNEQLSQVRFIFSDKTGTLTENIMTYKRGDVFGNPISSDNFDESSGYLKHPEKKHDVAQYFRVLALCHTIQPFPDGEDGLRYEGSSPDEVALVQAACAHGFILKKRTTRRMTLQIEGELVDYEIMATLEFTPDRKMMSIIIKDQRTKKIHLYTKGADSFVIPRMSTESAINKRTLGPSKVTLSEMAQSGLRTLLICTKEISEDQFLEWQNEFNKANSALVNRSAIVDEVCLKMELELSLVGVTAIEDKLQDKVPETLRFFLDAGVIVWMLTGDKRETAVTIAATSSLANPQKDYIVHIDIGDAHPSSDEAKALVTKQLEEVRRCVEKKDKKVSFVIDGLALAVAMHPDFFDTFLAISQTVASAVCCRLTPKQKANVVRMFQQATGSTAIAIGDGANDVSMIQEGRVGVGIVGMEGAQAALAADYAIPRFKHLKRLCAVHGRYALVRNATCTVCSFYKNILLSMTQFYFAFWAAYSGASLFDGWLLSFYNFAFTSMPPLFMGILEKDLQEKSLEENPSLLIPIRNGMYFDARTIAMWFGEAILHSIILFYVSFPTANLQDYDHRYIDGRMHGTTIMSCMIFLVLCKFALHIRYWVSMEAFGIVTSAAFFLCFLLAYSAIPTLFGDTSFHQSIYLLMDKPKYWFYILLFVLSLLIPIDMSIIFIQKQWFKTERDILQLEYAAETNNKV